MTRGVCWNCEFWNHDGSGNGECRRRAPTPCGKYGESSKFPQTKADDWCGEFQQAAETREQRNV